MSQIEHALEKTISKFRSMEEHGQTIHKSSYGCHNKEKGNDEKFNEP